MLILFVNKSKKPWKTYTHLAIQQGLDNVLEAEHIQIDLLSWPSFDLEASLRNAVRGRLEDIQMLVNELDRRDHWPHQLGLWRLLRRLEVGRLVWVGVGWAIALRMKTTLRVISQGNLW